METFLGKIAKFIKESDTQLENWTIILPSQRAVNYLQKEIYTAYERPVFSPKTFTINQWVKELTPQTILDKTRLLLALFEIHKKNGTESIDQQFDEFLSWGTTLLSDFDEIDRYLVDSKDLFKNLRDIKGIENWSFGEDQVLTERQTRFMEFWDRLPNYYMQFNEHIASKNIIYTGKAYAQLATHIDRVFTKNKDAKFIFAGFNALSKAEISIIKQLHQLGKAVLFIDSDRYYYDDKNHEAGEFLRRINTELKIKNPSFIETNLAVSTKKIDIINCAQTSGQTKVMSTIINKLTEEELDKTLVLLADEGLIIPVIHALPKKIGKANITMGLPLKNTSIKTWIELIFKIQEGFLKYDRVVAYHKDIENVWNHPFISSMSDKTAIRKIREKEKVMRKNNTVFQQPKNIDIAPLINEIIQEIYTPWKNNWKTAVEQFRKINSSIFKGLDTNYALEKIIIEAFDTQLIDFQNCVNENFPSMSLRTFSVLFQQTWNKESIAFYGNPLKGIQIMGLLETRLIDFKTIIILGMNEGKLPSTNSIQSIIPMDLRRHVGLPLPRDKQGLFAHHFYRLLHHCDHMYITYASSSEGVNSSEPSRYLLQLELELARLNPNILITKKDYTLQNNIAKTQLKTISKTPEIMQRLDELLEGGISASAIKTYINCPLDFYYKYILKFGEETKVDESIESNQLGTFIHAVLEDFYAPYCQKEGVKQKLILVEDIIEMKNACELKMREKFSIFFDHNPAAFETGKNFLSFKMALELTQRFLDYEKKILNSNGNKGIKIISLEAAISFTLELEIHGVMKQVKLKGFIDRIDSIDGKVRIIDYKSGKVKNEDVGSKIKKSSPTDPVDLLVDLSLNSKHFFQLMLYTFIYAKTAGETPSSSCIISLVNLNESPFELLPGDLSMNKLVELFPSVLKLILNEIYSDESSFEHKELFKSYCNYCS